MKDCFECNGSGKVNIIGYRDNAAPSIETKKMKKSINWQNTLRTVVPIGALCLVVGFFTWCAVYWDKEEKAFNLKAEKQHQEAKLINDKTGFVIAQYNSDGSLARCWIAHYKEYVVITGSSAMVPVVDMHNVDTKNPAHPALSIGISDADLGKCTVWDW